MRPALPRSPSPGRSSPARSSARLSILSAANLPKSEKKLSGSSIRAYRLGSQRAQCFWAIRPYRFMLGSFDGRDVVGREKRILRVPVRQGTGPGSPAPGAAGTGPTGSRGCAGDAVLEELLIFEPPVLPEQRFTRLLPRAAARHDPVPSGAL